MDVKNILIGIILCIILVWVFVKVQVSSVDRIYENIEEAYQGIAVNERYFYAINNNSIGKYNLANGKRVTKSKLVLGDNLSDLNGGRIKGDKLICTHTPKDGPNSLEIFNSKTLEHEKSIMIPVRGSLIWTAILNKKLYGFIAFNGNEINDSRLVEFGEDYDIINMWELPYSVTDELKPFTVAGGTIYDGKVYISGNNKSEIYELEIPDDVNSSYLKHIDTISVDSTGRGFDIMDGVIYCIKREEKQVTSAKLF